MFSTSESENIYYVQGYTYTTCKSAKAQTITK